MHCPLIYEPLASVPGSHPAFRRLQYESGASDEKLDESLGPRLMNPCIVSFTRASLYNLMIIIFGISSVAYTSATVIHDYCIYL